MAKIYLKAYQWILRAVVELLDLFPPRRIEKEEFALRKGILPDDYTAPEDGTIWVHGASLGEVITLRPFLQELAAQYGRERIVCTATTLDGLRQLRKDAFCGFATLLPIELPAFTQPFIDRIKPRLLLISETEIWPLLLDTLARRGIKYGIINARINEKTVRMMRIAWPLFSSAIAGMSFVFPQERQYQRRFSILGINREKQQILGCFKYDFSEAAPDTEAVRKRYRIQSQRPVICFGSTHANEEEQILDALEPLWGNLDAQIIIAPRHIKRVEEIEKILHDRKLDFCRLSQVDTTARRIILVDTLGELRNLYAISSLTFVGGSLIKRGGHNLMEPAAYAKPVITGPSVFNFRYEMMALNRAKAVITVKDPHELTKVLERWLLQPEEFIEIGQRAKQVLQSMSGASRRTITSLQQLQLLPPCQISK
jgi:3-deoxy-D-manno-octulosonic-acid transferase